MRAIDWPHFHAIEKVRKQIEKDKSAGAVKKIYLIALDEGHEVAPDCAESLGSYHDAYGLWFAGSLGATIRGNTGFAHAFTSAPPARMEDGSAHAINVYGIPCKLYFWRSQGYNRGAILADEDPPSLHQTATALMAAKPWDFAPIFALIRKAVELNIGPHLPPDPVIVNFGKYQGYELATLAKNDPGYVLWLAENCKDKKIKEAAAKHIKDV